MLVPVLKRDTNAARKGDQMARGATLRMNISVHYNRASARLSV